MNGLTDERCSKTTRAPADDISAIIVYFLLYPRDRFNINVFNGSFAPPTVYIIPRCGPRNIHYIRIYYYHYNKPKHITAICSMLQET
jgi:hypothetical protein